MKKLLVLILCNIFVVGYAQKSEDIKAIKGQCGCFEVDFKYAETFAPSKDYKFRDRYHTGGTEYVFVVEETKDRIVLQHLLAIGDTMVIKHWREDWIYEDPNLLSYYKDRKWKYSSQNKESIKRAWTQKVFEVDDSPRYEGTAQWSHLNGTHLWESKVDAPLPRREYTKRNDYNVMKRGNRIYVTDKGYLHEQDNDKIIRENGGDKLLAQEKGYNDYVKTDPKKCLITEKWWKENNLFWNDVRAVWQEILDKHQHIMVKQKVNNKMIFEEFDVIEKEKNTSDINRKKLRETLTKFVTYEGDLLGKK